MASNASPSEIAHATSLGNKTQLPNGDIMHTARHPNSVDHVIRVTSRNGKVMSASVHREPISTVIMRKKKIEGEAKAKADKSKANRAAQLEKKRARSAAANNQNKKNK
jgi:hypothetical protein